MARDAYRAFLETPIGFLEIIASAGAVVAVRFGDGPPDAASDSNPILEKCLAQLRDYFLGRRRAFDLKLDPAGTPFQIRVWDALREIPFGRTTTYGRIAESLGTGKAVRAVGAANGRNPIPILIPCHRVIGSDGRLTGFGGGLWRKAWLLNHEGVSGFRSVAQTQPTLFPITPKR